MVCVLILMGDTNIESVDLTGKVIEKRWSKNFESWNAGGSAYYVLDVGDPVGKEGSLNGQSVKVATVIPAGKRTALEGVILRPSKAITFEEFTKYVGKKVTVTGVYLPGKRYKPPPGSMESIPVTTNPITGEEEYPIRGSGFRVDQITVIEDQPQ